MPNNHASSSSPVLDSPSKVVGLIFLNSPSRWSTYFLFLSGILLSAAEGVPSDELSPFSISRPEFLEAPFADLFIMVIVFWDFLGYYTMQQDFIYFLMFL
jgi:hypothetical protein